MSIPPCVVGGAVDIINRFFSDILEHIENDKSLTECKVSVCLWMSVGMYYIECLPLFLCPRF